MRKTLVTCFLCPTTTSSHGEGGIRTGTSTTPFLRRRSQFYDKCNTDPMKNVIRQRPVAGIVYFPVIPSLVCETKPLLRVIVSEVWTGDANAVVGQRSSSCFAASVSIQHRSATKAIPLPREGIKAVS
eukprot:TRINITY_DN27397_c0_g1_i1.p2 TRINITY_DN27397_c0_g1~~TRINITY_DN27397_c0_g1_i1.p2  ORF type:complete len:128 (-),score=1.05 TRINITY_DN27397_c0_g1_i1:141-524(-)